MPDSGSVDEVHLGVDLPHDLLSVRAARQFVARSLTGPVPSAVVDDLVLATSELVTNAVEHGAPAPVRVSVDLRQRIASVIVRSAGDRAAIAEVDGWRVGEPERRSGRGLGIVRQIADVVDVTRFDGYVEIAVRRHLDHAR